MHEYDSLRLSPRVLLHAVDSDSLQGRTAHPESSQVGTRGTVVGVSAIENFGGEAETPLFAVKLDSGELIECAPWEITEDDEMPAIGSDLEAITTRVIEHNELRR